MSAPQTEATNVNGVSAAQNAALLRSQIEGFTNFDKTLVPGGSVKKLMEELKAPSSDLYQVDPRQIVVIEGFNPRIHNRRYFERVAALAADMKERGYLKDKPLAVYVSKIDGVDRLVLQDGHRRHAAVLQAIENGANIKTVPVVVKDKKMTMEDLTLDLLRSNESEPFTVYEKAVIAKRLKTDFGHSNSEVATLMGCTPAFVGQMLELVGAPEALQELVDSGQISATHAYDLIKEHGHEQATEVAQRAVATAKAQGKKKATAKDLTPAEDRNLTKTKNARKVGLDFYKLVVKISKDEAVMKKMPDALCEEMDRLIEIVERKPKVKAAPKEPKAPKAPKAIKPIKVKGDGKASRGAKASQKTQKSAEEFWAAAEQAVSKKAKKSAAA